MWYNNSPSIWWDTQTDCHLCAHPLQIELDLYKKDSAAESSLWSNDWILLSCQIWFHLCHILSPLCIPTGFWSSTWWHYYLTSSSDLSWLQSHRRLISGLLVLPQQKRQSVDAFSAVALRLSNMSTRSLL